MGTDPVICPLDHGSTQSRRNTAPAQHVSQTRPYPQTPSATRTLRYAFGKEKLKAPPLPPSSPPVRLLGGDVRPVQGRRQRRQVRLLTPADKPQPPTSPTAVGRNGTAKKHMGVSFFRAGGTPLSVVLKGNQRETCHFGGVQ